MSTSGADSPKAVLSRRQIAAVVAGNGLEFYDFLTYSFFAVQIGEALFPGGGDTTQATFWTGLRPMTPDGTPVVGRTPLSNLFLNTGHGTLGWTMSCGSGQLLADLISGKQPAIKADDLSVYRYLGDTQGTHRPAYA